MATLRRAVARAGRMALTNYLGQNIVAGVIFFGYGFGLRGALSHLEVFGVACLIYAAQLAVSAWWMARASGGPFERLWRRLTYPKGR